MAKKNITQGYFAVFEKIDGDWWMVNGQQVNRQHPADKAYMAACETAGRIHKRTGYETIVKSISIS